MRCPKCGYITFDHLETCTKCKKKIAAISEQLTGTVFNAEAPAFLQLDAHKQHADTDASIDQLPENDDIGVEFTFDEKEEVVSDKTQAAEEIEIDFTDEGMGALTLQNDEGEEEVDLDLFAEESVELKFDLDTEESDVEEEIVEPQLDLNLSELDISDLAPPVENEDDLFSAELIVEDPAPAPAAKPDDSAQPSMGDGGLEDLQVDGLDLGITPLPPAPSDTSTKIRPSVKTGTALDEFNIDLGELILDKDT